VSTGTGSTGGSGYRVEVDSLRAFATQVRGLLSEFESGAGGNRVNGQTGVAPSAFGHFAEAEALHKKYEVMRANLSDVLIALQEAIEDAQHKADLTATNYEEQEQETSRKLTVNGDGWSVGNSRGSVQPGSFASGPTSSSRPLPPTSNSSPAGAGEPQQTW